MVLLYIAAGSEESLPLSQWLLLGGLRRSIIPSKPVSLDTSSHGHLYRSGANSVLGCSLLFGSLERQRFHRGSASLLIL